MTKRPSLADRAPKKATAPQEAPAPRQSEQTGPTRERREYKSVLAKVDNATHAQLRHMAIDQDKPVGDLLVEALNLLFARYDQPQIATKVVA